MRGRAATCYAALAHARLSLLASYKQAAPAIVLGSPLLSVAFGAVTCDLFAMMTGARRTRDDNLKPLLALPGHARRNRLGEGDGKHFGKEPAHNPHVSMPAVARIALPSR